jgi:hypothetical protein
VETAVPLAWMPDPAGVTGVACRSVTVEVAQTRVFFAEATVTTRLRHWLCGAQTPQKRTNGWRGGGTNAAKRARNCTGVMSRTWSVFDAVTDLAVVEHGEPLEREGRTSAVAEQAFACGGQPSGHPDAGVEIELQVLRAQALGRLRQRASSCWASALLGAAVLDPAL